MKKRKVGRKVSHKRWNVRIKEPGFGQAEYGEDMKGEKVVKVGEFVTTRSYVEETER